MKGHTLVFNLKIRIAEERKQIETSGSMENKGNKKSHFWLDFRVLICLIFSLQSNICLFQVYFVMIVCTCLAILVVTLKVRILISAQRNYSTICRFYSLRQRGRMKHSNNWSNRKLTIKSAMIWGLYQTMMDIFHDLQ